MSTELLAVRARRPAAPAPGRALGAPAPALADRSRRLSPSSACSPPTSGSSSASSTLDRRRGRRERRSAPPTCGFDGVVAYYSPVIFREPRADAGLREPASQADIGRAVAEAGAPATDDPRTLDGITSCPGTVTCGGRAAPTRSGSRAGSSSCAGRSHGPRARFRLPVAPSSPRAPRLTAAALRLAVPLVGGRRDRLGAGIESVR